MTPLDGAGRDSVDLERIRARVAAALPDYMTPAAYVVLDEIPITAHGKIDRTALPEPEIVAKAEYRDPATVTERRIAALFSGLLGHDRVGVDDSFFDLGGHSLVATKLVTAIRSECGVELGIRDIFELGTVGLLAQRVDELRSGGRGAVAAEADRDHTRRTTAAVGVATAQLVRLPRRRAESGQQHPVRGQVDRAVGHRRAGRRGR